MYEGQTVAAVIPAYNEADHVGGVIESLPAFVDRAYVVDDGSTDDTWGVICEHADGSARGDPVPLGAVDPALADVAVPPEVAETITADPPETPDERDGADSPSTPDERDGTGSPEPPDERDGADPSEDGTADAPLADGGEPFERRIVPVRHRENGGVGAAITTGYRVALVDGVDVAAVVCADGQTEPDILERIVAPVARGEVDYAKGNRLRRDHRADMPRGRRFGNFLLSYLTKVASGYWTVGDPQDGTTAISREALSELDLAALYEDYGFANDLLVRLNAIDATVGDVSRRAVYGDEESYIRLRSLIPRLSWLLLCDFCWRLRVEYADERVHPVVASYGIGAPSAAAGVAYCLRAAVSRGRSDGLRTGAALLVGGLVALAAAMAMDRAENAHLDRRIEE